LAQIDIQRMVCLAADSLSASNGFL